MAAFFVYLEAVSRAKILLDDAVRGAVEDARVVDEENTLAHAGHGTFLMRWCRCGGPCMRPA